jgi:hypothetical protein
MCGGIHMQSNVRSLVIFGAIFITAAIIYFAVSMVW